MLKELIALTQVHLLQEYKKDAYITTDPDNYDFFKKFAQNEKIESSSIIKPPPKKTETISETESLKPLATKTKTLDETEPTSLKPLATKTKTIDETESTSLKPLATKTKTIDETEQTSLQPLTTKTKTIDETEQTSLKPLTTKTKTIDETDSISLTTRTKTIGEIKNPSLLESTKSATKTPPPPILEPLKIKTEKISTNHQFDLSDMQKIMNEQFPQITIHQAPLDDSLAKSMANKWKSESAAYPAVLILNFKESPEEIAFLSNMAKGIQQKLATAALMAVEKWDSESDKIQESNQVKLIITSNTVVKLLQHQAHIEGESRYLKGIPLIILLELSSYAKDPQLKMVLWKNIQSALQPAK